jgi:hypothetical protein
VFVSRLHPCTGEPPGFFLVGSLSIAEVKPDLREDPGPGWWDGNAHVRRSRVSGSWDSFWVFRGDGRSRLFDRALPFGRREADTVFAHAWRWPDDRTDLQTIGSYTRAVRRLTGSAERRLHDLLAGGRGRGRG